LQDLADAAAAHGNPLGFAQVRGQAIERPRRERQAEVGWPRQRCRDHHCDLLRRVGRRPARPLALLEPGEAVGVEALEPEAGRPGMQAQALRDRRRCLPFHGQQHQLRPLDPARAQRPGSCHPRELALLLEAEGTDPDRHGWPP
jgi:hypothetical protein